MTTICFGIYVLGLRWLGPLTECKRVDRIDCHIYIRFGENMYPKETLGHDLINTVAIATIYVWILTFLPFVATDNPVNIKIFKVFYHFQ